MSKRFVFFLFLVCIGIADLQASTSTSATGLAGRGKSNEQDLQTQLIKSTPVATPDPGPPQARHLFPVNDAKGLLLTCIAPEIDTNQDTDLFRDCTLAPGRTLDDVMHTFIGAIHFMQSQEIKERAILQKDLEEKPGIKEARK
jgi:hypothetical protein